MHEGYNLLTNVPRTTKEYLKSEYINTECFKMEGSFFFFFLGQVNQKWFHGQGECRVQRNHSYRINNISQKHKIIQRRERGKWGRRRRRGRKKGERMREGNKEGKKEGRRREGGKEKDRGGEGWEGEERKRGTKCSHSVGRGLF